MAETQLTLAARALGFDESAKSVDLLAEAQKRLAENQKELEQAKTGGTVGDIATLTAEQRNLNTVIEGTAPAAEAAKGELHGLNVRQQDMVAILNQLDPRLGALAGTLSRASRVAGEFGLSLSTVGIAVAGVYALAKAWEFATEQIEKATEAQKKHQDATNEFLKQQKDLSQSLESIADKRREGGLTADQAREATTTAAGIKEQFGADLDPGAVDEAVALLSGTGASRDEIARTAFAISRGTLDLDAKRPAGRRRSQAGRVTGRGGERTAFDIMATRVAAQQRETAQEAAKQATSGGGPDLEEMIRQALGPGTPDEEVAQTMKDVQQFPRGVPARPAGLRRLFDRGPGLTYTQEANLARAVNYITINNQNQQHIGADSETQRQRRVNGTSEVQKVEGWGGAGGGW